MLDSAASPAPMLSPGDGGAGRLAPLRLTRLDGSVLHLEAAAGPCALMAVLNVTPDSFSDGGRYAAPQQAVRRAHELLAQGAQILDVGAESTRPGATLLTAEEEWARLAEVVKALAREPLPVVLSIDTRHAATAWRAAEAGFSILNLTFPQHLVSPIGHELPLSSSERRALIAAFDATVLMHSRGLPATMLQLSDYGTDLCQTVVNELASTVNTLLADDLADGRADQALRARLIYDPGLGFAKTAAQSLTLLGSVPRLKALLGGRLLIGASRKSLLGRATGLPVEERMVPSVAAAALAAFQGADVVRVHDVAETRAALELCRAVQQARPGEAP